MKEGWKDLHEVKKLPEERRKREAEPEIEFLFAEANSVLRLLISQHGTAVYQVHRHVVRNMKMIPEFSFIKKLSWSLWIGAAGTCTFPATLLTLTSYIGRSYTPSH